ncbi:replication/maintenance protein RepL, partial [Casaltella massiliensis]|nr:replication/maintenance protein RepL [Casaltella massiliensis]
KRGIFMPYQKKTNETIYQDKDVWINQRTGEVIEADQVIKKVPRNGFEITYLSYFFDLFDQLGGQKYKVFKYIIENKNSDNQLIITTRELAEKTKTSLPTVSATLKLLKESNLIQQRTGAIMLNPKLAHRGKDTKEKYLLTKFDMFEEDTK